MDGTGGVEKESLKTPSEAILWYEEEFKVAEKQNDVDWDSLDVQKKLEFGELDRKLKMLKDVQEFEPSLENTIRFGPRSSVKQTMLSRPLSNPPIARDVSSAKNSVREDEEESKDDCYLDVNRRVLFDMFTNLAPSGGAVSNDAKRDSEVGAYTLNRLLNWQLSSPGRVYKP